MISTLTEGQVLAGKYRVERILGKGGMGVVVQATHLHLAQRVAIKFLYDNATPEVVTRFLREARSSVRLKSEHVARVLDVGELEGGAPYMVMEYLEGSDLSGVLKQRGALPILQAVEYVLHACEAIAEAHAAGIVHRDLKPANLFLTTAADGTHTVKVLDFGISKAADSAEPGAEPEMALTKTTAVLGSPLYMAPEQMRSARTVDARADIWSLGTIIYQLLANQVPFNAGTYPELIMMVNTERPPPLSKFRGDVPPELEAAVFRCLERDVSLRFQNVAELAWALVPFGPSSAQTSAERISRMLGVQAQTQNAPPERTSVSSPATSSSPPGATTTGATAVTANTNVGVSGETTVGGKPERRSPIGLVAGAVALLAIGGGVAFFAMGRNATPPPEAAAATAEVETAIPAPPSTPSVAPEAAPPPPEPSTEPSASASATPSAAPTAPKPNAQTRPASAPTPKPTATATQPTQDKKNPLEMKPKF